MSNNIIKNIPNKVFVRNGNTGFGYPTSPSFIFPSFLFSPYSADYNPTTSFTLYAVVSATGPISYQWYKNDISISGATNTTYTITCATTADTAFYKVVATTPLGAATSEEAFIYINIPPYFILEPTSGIQDPNYSFTFTASALGTDPLIYQWLKNGVIIPGANSPTYTIDPVQESDQALYRVSVSNKAGSILSIVASLSVNDPAGIVSNPSNYYISLLNDGTETATFSSLVSGTPPIFYQWWRKTSSSPSFSPIVGANNSSYTTPVLSLSNNEEKFYVAATNSALFGSVVSTHATLSVVPAELNFTTIPVGLTANPGFIATLQSSASGMLPISYQWYKDGSQLIGATTPTLSLNGGLGIIEANQGYYQVSITNAFSSLTSDPAVLVFVNDPIFITSQPTSRSVVAYNNTTFTVSAIGEQPLKYQWYKNSTIVNGATGSSYTITSAINTDEGSYFCVLSNVATPSLTTNVAFLTVQYPVGIISTSTNLYDGLGTILSTTTANNISVNPGTYVAMTVSLTGTLIPINYQWYKNGAALTDETFGNSSALAINVPIDGEWSGVDEVHQGNYQVVVWNAVNSVTSTQTFLNVNNPITIVRHPSSTNVAVLSSITLSVSAIGEEPIKYQWYKNATIIGGASSNSYTINSTTTSDQGTYFCVLSNVTTTNSLLTTNVARLSVLYPIGISFITTSLYDAIGTGLGATSATNVSVNPGTYVIMAVTVSGSKIPSYYKWYRNGVELTDELGGASDVLAINTPVGGEWSGVDEIHQGNYQVVASNAINSVTSTPTFLNVNNPITIVRQPSSVFVTALSSATFSVSAIGEEPIKYQWYKNSTIISGASSNIYFINSATQSDVSTYVCVLSNVTNTYSPISTNVVRLSVYTPAQITIQPVNILSAFNSIGNEATFNVSVTGTPPYVYRWYKKEIYIDGFGTPVEVNTLLYTNNSSEYVVDKNRPITTEDFGTYFVKVSNAFGESTSASATLTGTFNNIQLWNFELPSTTITYSAGYFNGNSALSSASSADYNLNSTDFTIEGYFFCNGLTSGNQTIIDKDGLAGASYPQYDISVGPDGILRFIAGNGTGLTGGAGTYGWDASGPISLSAWHHFAVTRSGNTISLFYDGNLDSQHTVSHLMSASNTKPLIIGYQAGQSQSAYFNGYISNVRIVKNQAIYNGNFTPSKQPLTSSTLGATGSGVVGSVNGLLGVQAEGCVLDSLGNLFITDRTNHIIRKISPSGSISTFAGSPGILGEVDGTGSSARFTVPLGITRDSSNNLYVCDQNGHTIRKITSSGAVTTFAGLANTFGSTNATGSAARFYFPKGIVCDASDNLFVTDENGIRKITPAAAVTTFAIAPSGLGISALRDLTIDSSGNLYVCDQYRNHILKVTSSGVVSIFAGSVTGQQGTTDGTGSAARFNSPIGIVTNSLGDMFVSDSGTHVLRKMNLSAVVTSFAGLSNSNGVVDGTGSAARFDRPTSMAIDGSNNIYVQDSSNYTIRKVTSTSVVTTFAGTVGKAGTANSLSEDVSLLTLRDSTFIDTSKNPKTLSNIGSPSAVSVSIPFFDSYIIESINIGLSSGSTQYLIWGDGTYESNLSSAQTTQHFYSRPLSVGITTNLNNALTGFGWPDYPQVYTFYVIATGTDVRYQWYNKQDTGPWTLIPSATSNKYTVDGVNYGITTLMYYVRVYNTISTVNSLTGEISFNNE